jgi:uncharacterized protein (DUF2164 family)
MPKNETGRRVDISCGEYGMYGFSVNIAIRTPHELSQDIGGFDAEFLIDFFAAEIGSYFYNRGLKDAQLLFTEKAEELGYLVQEMEKPTN